MPSRRLRVGACLSLTGEYARFGTQAAAALEAWRSLDGAADLVVEDDRSERGELERGLRRLAAPCDLLLGPYSTRLMRTAGDVAADLGRLLWNHGGSGDDVQAARPGHIVSVPTPTSRYAEPFLRHLRARAPAETGPLWLAPGKGAFARQVVDGALASARSLGIDAAGLRPAEELPDVAGPWALLCAASFEADVATVERARRLPNPPRIICAVAAGVREFGTAVRRPEGVFGIGQWLPGAGHAAALGPSEARFLAAYRDRVGTPPDYPAAQAAAIAAACARQTGGTSRADLWQAACALRTTTFFGDFEIDPSDGMQIGHRGTLVQWTAQEMAPI